MTFRCAGRSDPLVREAVQRLMPWHPVEIGALAEHLAISTTQLWRRCLHLVGVGPKALQRTLRFQGFLALAQAGATPSGRTGVHGLAGLAVDVGYADQAHLSRECVRLTGLSPRELLGDSSERCGCGHDHASRTLQEPLDWNASLIKGDLAEGVTALKRQHRGNLLAFGCGELAYELASRGLADEVHFWVQPAVWGSGERAFHGRRVRLRLIATTVFDSGVALLSYRPAPDQRASAAS